MSQSHERQQMHNLSDQKFGVSIISLKLVPKVYTLLMISDKTKPAEPAFSPPKNRSGDAPSGGYGYRRQGGCSDPAGVAGAVATEPWEVTAIASALQQYLDGCHCNVSALRTIFHPSAQLKGVNKEGELEVVSSENFFERVEARRANMHAEDVGRPSELDRILRIDRGGPRAAAATVQVAISGGVDGDVLYTDHLSLLKLGGDSVRGGWAEGGGQWWIVHKSWSAVPLRDSEPSPAR